LAGRDGPRRAGRRPRQGAAPRGSDPAHGRQPARLARRPARHPRLRPCDRPCPGGTSLMLLNQEQTQADQALLQLGRRLRADGYRFTCVTPATHARNNAREGAERARTLRDVFGWSRPFPPSLLSLDELEQLRTAQVLEEAGERLRAKVRWSNLDDLLLVHSAFPTEASDAVFFGPDSYRFAQVIHDHLQRSPSRVQHAVDIGCGTGIGALIIARAAPHAQVSALDINPLALRYTAINA